MQNLGDLLKRFFLVFLSGRTYLNMLYLFISFPLGIIYFVLLVTGIAVGIPLIIVWVGIALLLGVYGLWYVFIVIERQQAIWLLGEKIAPIQHLDTRSLNLWGKFKASVANPVMWKGLVFLLTKLLLGSINFTVMVSFLSTSLAFIAAPIYYRLFQPRMDLVFGTAPISWTLVDTLPEALIMSLVGILLLLVTMHIMNGLAYINGKFAKVMLGRSTSTSNPAGTMDPTTTEPPTPNN